MAPDAEQVVTKLPCSCLCRRDCSLMLHSWSVHDIGVAIGLRPIAARALIWGAMAAGAASLGCSGSHGEGEHPGFGSERSALVGGREIPRSAWPNIVRIGQVCTGILLRSDLVVYAAHCGTYPAYLQLADDRRVHVDRCWTYPRASYGGTDIAFCVLEAPVDGVRLVPPALGGEVDWVAPGSEVTLVGYGLSTPTDSFGTLREAVATIDAIGEEIEVSGPDVGTCSGDSGGPAFVKMGSEREWRIAGILSSGPIGECGPGISYYTRLSSFVPWIEEQSKCDVSPCHTAEGKLTSSERCDIASLEQYRTPCRRPDSVNGENAGGGGCGLTPRGMPPIGMPASWLHLLALYARRRRVRKHPRW
jgi:hypothetical protein